MGAQTERRVTISSCTTSHGDKDKCREAFDGVTTEGSNGWNYGNPDSTAWGYFQLAEASDVSGVSILSGFDTKHRIIKKFSIQCYQGDTVVDVTNVRPFSGEGASITDNRIRLTARHRALREDFDPVPGCTGVKLQIFSTFSRKNSLWLNELSIFTSTEQRTVTISSCTTSHENKKECHEAFDGITTERSNGWHYSKSESTTWGDFQLAEASDVNGVSILSGFDRSKTQIKDFSIQCFQGDALVDVTNVRLFSGQGASITGNRITLTAKQRALRVDFDPVPGCTGVKLQIFSTFSSKNALWLNELSIFTSTEIPSYEQLKSMVKATFEGIKSPENKSALPGLIRKAFHDAGHFDKNNGEVRMGCIQHFLSGNNACPQHANFEEAESVVKAVMDRMPSNMLSMADAVQLLGALAVDELAQGTGAAPLYGRVRTGRVDPTTFTCIENIQMCRNLPAFFTRQHSQFEHADVVISLNDVWVKEIEGKMIDINSFSKQDAVALIGAHTVGRHFSFGHWTQNPNFFDNEYFLQLKRVKDWLDSGNKLGEVVGEQVVHPFGFNVFPNWFKDSEEVQDPEAVMPGSRIMMLDADLALVLNAPELIEKYAADVTAWRQDFDDAYIVMSELGFASLDPPLDETNRLLLQRSEALLDDDFEFFQNLQILQEEQVKKIHAAFRRKL